MLLAETQAGAESQYYFVHTFQLQVFPLSLSPPVLTYSDFKAFC